MRVLAVGAHPDDIEQLCGGTLARYVYEGHDVTVCHVSKGDCGSFVHTRDEISRIRDEESRKAASILGASYVNLGLSDGAIYASNREHRELVIDLVRQVKPDIVITHPTNDYMPDHVEVGRLVEAATFVATLPLYETAEPFHDSVSALYYMDTIAGCDFIPTEYVDISDFASRKIDALKAHESQLSWLKEHDGVDIVDQTTTLGKLRGFQSGVAQAEGFQADRRWLRNRTTRLLP